VPKISLLILESSNTFVRVYILFMEISELLKSAKNSSDDCYWIQLIHNLTTDISFSNKTMLSEVNVLSNSI
jgi:hypothetical protein